MEKNKENFDMEYILYGERRPGCFGLLVQSVVAMLKFVFFPHGLTVGDARRLKEIHERTGIGFPIKSERINRKERRS